MYSLPLFDCFFEFLASLIMTNHTLCHIDDIPDNSAKGFTVEEHSLVAVKQWGKLYLYINNCPHLGLPLEWMPDQFLDADGQYIQCATHGALFKINSGECIAGPCEGDSLQAVPFSIHNDHLEVTL